MWIVNCPVNKHVGMWQRWFRSQCVAVGWPPGAGYQLDVPGDRAWNVARNCLLNMNVGDRVVVALGDRRVGRIGEITHMAVGDDEWDPFVPPGEEHVHGELGRRIQVRWELDTGPSDSDVVVQLPRELGAFSRTTVSQRRIPLRGLRREMNNPANWVSLHGTFASEKAMSDYIGKHPYRLEDGLVPHPTRILREMRFEDGRRADVMLMDRNQRTVIVECKQHSPSVTDIEQLRGYMQQFENETGETPRGILVHGGAPRLSPDVRRAADRRRPRIEVVYYVLFVTFGAR